MANASQRKIRSLSPFMVLCPKCGAEFDPRVHTIAHRAVGTDGCMSQLHDFTCDLEHLPKLISCLRRALAVANKHGLIKQTSKR